MFKFIRDADIDVIFIDADGGTDAEVFDCFDNAFHVVDAGYGRLGDNKTGASNDSFSYSQLVL